MKGNSNTYSCHAIEPRQRLSVSIFQRSKSRNAKKPYTNFLDLIKCKFTCLKLVLAAIISLAFITLICSPDLYHGNNPNSGWIMTDKCYASDLNINWNVILKEVAAIKNGSATIGLLNFNRTEINNWKHAMPDANHAILHLGHVAKNVTWDSLYPEWIDEDHENEVPTCPSLPVIKPLKQKRVDIIVVKLPCRKGRGNWSRDVARFHLQVAAARLAISVEGFVYPTMHFVFVSQCFPMPNLFPCKELIARNGDVWVYKSDLKTMRYKLRLPLGSCQLALTLPFKENTDTGSKRREAYATILHSADSYVCGAMTLAQSIRMTGSTRDLVILADSTISAHHRRGLEAAGWKVRTIERIRNPKAERDAYNEWNYSKFRLWQLTDYDKVVFIDADMLVLRNIDFLFSMPEISATGNNACRFNSGVMLLVPSNCTFRLLMDHINDIESYNGGDQGYLNEVFTSWYRIPRLTNFLKHFWQGDDAQKRADKTRMFGADPPVLYVLHYLGLKPWSCFRDYDCNWNVDVYREFASDAAHARWWKVHDAMPERLQRFCEMETTQKAALEWDRRRAEEANYTDGHWRIRIRDPRLNRCVDNFCSWKTMLKHWGNTANWTDARIVNGTSPPAINVVE